MGRVVDKILVVFLSLALSGCSATMITYGDSVYGPSDQKKGGVVKYSIAGADPVIQSRKDDAYKKMNKYCSGKYKISYQGLETKGNDAVVMPITDGIFAGSAVASSQKSEEWVIKFECE